MFDGESNDRDYLDSNVIMSTAGGGLVRDKATGKMKPGSDQVEGNDAEGLQNCMKH